MTRRALLSSAAAAYAVRQANLDEACRILQSQVDAHELSAAVLLAQRGRTTLVERAFGRAPDASAIFLLASISKPMTAAALLTLVDKGRVALDQPVQRYLPAFQHGDVLLRQLLNHTSGLPDMLPDDVPLRQRHAPLSDFVDEACRTPLLFRPGSEVRYQSMGLLLAAEIVQTLTGQPFPAFLQANVFAPLGMRTASLGLGGRALAQTMQCQVKTPSDWDWNSAYWRNLASPWGGAHGSVHDIARLLRAFAHPRDQQVLKPATAAAMIANTTTGLNKRWGLGWMLHAAQFGKNSSDATFGHSGSTGTLCWHDPAKDLTFVLLTTKPAAESSKTILVPVADCVSAA